MDVSAKRCESGCRTAARQHKFQSEEERPCYIVGLVDDVEYEAYQDGYQVHMKEKDQTRTQTQYLN